MAGVSRCIFLRINTVVSLLGDVIRGNSWLVQAEMEGCKVGKKFVGIFHRTSVSGG